VQVFACSERMHKFEKVEKEMNTVKRLYGFILKLAVRLVNEIKKLDVGLDISNIQIRTTRFKWNVITAQSTWQ